MFLCCQERDMSNHFAICQMPKVYVKHYKPSTKSVYARNEPLDLLERIDVPRETRAKYANVGKPRKAVKPKNRPLIRRPARHDVVTWVEAQCNARRLQNEQFQASLAARITSSPPPLE